jgi:Tfp pilus assembly protein PilV
MFTHHAIFTRRRANARRRGSGRRPAVRRAFTLLEAALATMIVGVGLVAMLQLIAAGTSANLDGMETTTAVNLTKDLRELTLKKTFDEVRAMNGQAFHPPVDSRGITVTGFDDWSQNIAVQPVDRDRLTTDVVTTTPNAVRVTVTVTRNGRNRWAVSWYRFKPMP